MRCWRVREWLGPNRVAARCGGLGAGGLASPGLRGGRLWLARRGRWLRGVAVAGRTGGEVVRWGRKGGEEAEC